MIRRSPSVIVAAALLLSAGAGPAYAYLDPGAGSMVLQGLIAALAGGAVAARTFWSRIVLFFSGARTNGADAEDAGDEASPGQ